MENPNKGKTMNVPTSDTGTASSGIRVARQPWRKMNTTRMTSKIASKSVFTISLMPSVTDLVVSRATTYWRSFGNRSLSCAIIFFAPSAAAISLVPGS